MVDDYAGEWVAEKRTQTSRSPLTLLELESYFNGALSIFVVLDMNCSDGGHDLDCMLSFNVSIESQFHPQMGTLYAHRIAVWSAMHRGATNMDRSVGADSLPATAIDDPSVPR